MTFLGHVQVIAPLGIIGIFLSYFLKEYNMNKKSFLLFILSIINMFFSYTSASYISLIVIIFGLVLMKYQKSYKNIDAKIIFICFIILNFIFFYILKRYDCDIDIFGFNINGRGFIWKEALLAIHNSIFIGYGVQGVLLKVFWSKWVGDGSGMNYAHNDILQVLLDGGAIQLILFILMIFSYLNNVKKCKDKKMITFSNLCLISMLIVMSFESVMNYFYIFIFLSIMAYLPEISSNIKNKKECR